MWPNFICLTFNHKVLRALSSCKKLTKINGLCNAAIQNGELNFEVLALHHCSVDTGITWIWFGMLNDR